MPLKTCPECGAEHGPRKKECDCGYAFTTKSNHPLVPEPGGWVLDTGKGMPKIEPPEPLPRGQLDTEIVRDVISYEGLGFAIYSLIPASRISDPWLKKLWVKARNEMQRVVEYVYNT